MKNNISYLDSCYGCGVCQISCPKSAIQMDKDPSGFYQPSVDDQLCIDCGLCVKNCSYINAPAPVVPASVTGYEAWSKDLQTRLHCTTAGFTFELAKLLLQKGYKACVVKYHTENKRAEHYMASTEEELLDSIGSKYMPSWTVPGFSQFKKGEKYFVVGSPCQMASLRNYIRRKKIEHNFVLLDFFCHGVPSLHLWEKYGNAIQKNTGHIQQAVWRNKFTQDIQQYDLRRRQPILSDQDYDWPTSTNLFFKGSKGIYNSRKVKGDLYFSFFLGDRCLGKACYDHCEFKMYHSAADIRVCDLWGHTYAEVKAGVNGVLALTEVGRSMVELLKESRRLHIQEILPERVAEGQMKENARRSRSYPYVIKALAGTSSLRSIHRWACLIESPATLPRAGKYYFFRILQKLRIIK